MMKTETRIEGMMIEWVQVGASRYEFDCPSTRKLKALYTERKGGRTRSIMKS